MLFWGWLGILERDKDLKLTVVAGWRYRGEFQGCNTPEEVKSNILKTDPVIIQR